VQKRKRERLPLAVWRGIEKDRRSRQKRRERARIQIERKHTEAKRGRQLIAGEKNRIVQDGIC
jgi:hypothetical protein